MSTDHMILAYAGVRAQTLGLDPSLWGVFGNVAARYLEEGMSHEAALQAAQREIFSVSETA